MFFLFEPKSIISELLKSLNALTIRKSASTPVVPIKSRSIKLNLTVNLILLNKIYISVFLQPKQVGGFNGRNINKIISEVFEIVGLISNRYLMSIKACLLTCTKKNNKSFNWYSCFVLNRKSWKTGISILGKSVLYRVTQGDSLFFFLLKK